MRYKSIARKTVWGAGLFPPWWDEENSQAIGYVFRYGHCIITVRGAAKICGFLRSSASINLPPELPGILHYWQQTLPVIRPWVLLKHKTPPFLHSIITVACCFTRDTRLLLQTTVTALNRQLFSNKCFFNWYIIGIFTLRHFP